MLFTHVLRRSRSCARRLENVILGKWAFHRSVMAPRTEPILQPVFVPEPIAMLPDPGRILLDVASRPITFQTPPVYVLETRDLWLDRNLDAAGAAIAVDVFGDLEA